MTPLLDDVTSSPPLPGVWKAYGKFNLSAPSRNQSPQALRNYLVRIEQTACASALDCLVSYIEKEFKKKVLPS